jgi:pyruvate/2-oxoglutarate dehydrogenase complex dihydrolipoamide acyltransferase (E2) component
MATSAAKLELILKTVCSENDLLLKNVLKQLNEKDLLPGKMKTKDSKDSSIFASKKAEEFATLAKLNPTGEGSGKFGKFTLSDIKKIVEQPSDAKLLVSPTALKFANEQGLIISDITGTGQNGRILLKDVEATVKAVKAESDESDDEEINISPRALDAATIAKIDQAKLKTVKGTGKGGRIILQNVKDLIKSDSEASNSDTDCDTE